MKTPLDALRRGLIEAILPEVAFDGWSRAALRRAARRLDIPSDEATALFPGGAADLVAGFSRWIDECMLDRLEAADLEPLGTAERIGLAIDTRLDIIGPWREAVRRALTLLALPVHTALGMRLLYGTVDAIWYAAGDAATDFSFYSKRASLAAIWAATLLYWLEDRSEGAVETRAFVERRLAGMARFGGMRRAFAEAAARLPNPFRLFRPLP